jgi:4-amino-4-deoxy-L-arabinose transferase-like glycosyltransferase
MTQASPTASSGNTGRTPVEPGAFWERTTLVAIVAAGVAVRVAFLGVAIRYDEAYTYNEYARFSAYDGISLYTFPNNHLLHTLLVHVIVRLLGHDPWMLRLPALLAGFALIPAVHVMARRFAGAPAGLLTAALVAGSEPLVDYAANARGYSLLCFITVALVAVAQRLRQENRTGSWVALTLLPPLGLFTIPIMLLPWGGVILWLVVMRFVDPSRKIRLDRLLASTLFAGALTLVLYAPALARTGIDSVVANPFVAPRPFDELSRQLPGNLARTWAGWNVAVPWPLTAALLAAWAGALIVPSPRRGGVRSLTGLVATMCLMSLAFVFYQRRVPFERVWLFLLPLHLACVGAGLAAVSDNLASRWQRGGQGVAAALAVVLCLALSGLVLLSSAIPDDAARLSIDQGDTLALDLKKRLTPRSAVVCELPCDGALKYHLILNGVPVEVLYDYRLQEATSVYLVVHRFAGQTAESVAAANRLRRKGWIRPAELVREFGRTAVHRIER